MRFALSFTLALFCIGICRAQTTAPERTTPDPGTPPPANKVKVIEQRAEKIHVEDAGTSIDELRVGGETKSIKVQPKGRLPAYDVAPVSGESSWKVLSF